MFKVMIKLKDGSWTHFCYLDNKYRDSALDVKTWAKQDFNLCLESSEDLVKLKEHIKERYRQKYPYIFRYTRIDAQGWTRIWVTEHLEGEI